MGWADLLEGNYILFIFLVVAFGVVTLVVLWGEDLLKGNYILFVSVIVALAFGA
jgi:heme exporter protein D